MPGWLLLFSRVDRTSAHVVSTRENFLFVFSWVDTRKSGQHVLVSLLPQLGTWLSTPQSVQIQMYTYVHVYAGAEATRYGDFAVWILRVGSR